MIRRMITIRRMREVCSPRSTMTRRMVRDIAVRMVRRRIRRRRRTKRRRRRNMVVIMIMMVVAAAAAATAIRSHLPAGVGGGGGDGDGGENKQEKQIDLINGDSSRSLL